MVNAVELVGYRVHFEKTQSHKGIQYNKLADKWWSKKRFLQWAMCTHKLSIELLRESVNKLYPTEDGEIYQKIPSQHYHDSI